MLEKCVIIYLQNDTESMLLKSLFILLRVNKLKRTICKVFLVKILLYYFKNVNFFICL